MALLLADGFRLYSDVAGALQVEGWGSAGGGPNFFAGRVSTSGAVSLAGPGFSPGSLSRVLAFSGATSIVGCAVQIPSLIGFTVGEFFHVSVGGVPVAMRAVAVTGGFSLRLDRNGGAFATLPGVYAAGVWYHLEMKVDWAVAGNVAVRVDGSEYHNAAMTLAAPTAGLTVGLHATVSGGVTRLADLLVMDASGSDFNGFMGDHIVETLFVTADGANSGWTRGPVSEAISSKFRSANVATVGTNNAHSFLVGDTITVVMSSDASFNGVFTVTAVGAFSVSYANPGANVGLTFGQTGTITGGSAHYTVVDEIGTNTGDTSNDYVFTSTVGAVDTYVMQDLATGASSSVRAVSAVFVGRKESAAVMGIAPLIRSAGTDYPGTARDLANTLAYTAESEWWLVDPATGAAWTRAAVNALEVGMVKTA